MKFYDGLVILLLLKDDDKKLFPFITDNNNVWMKIEKWNNRQQKMNELIGAERNIYCN